MKKYLIINLLVLIFLVTMVMAATTDFTADADITISAVTFGASTADLLILNNSTAESWSYDAGTFTVTNPGTFNIGSSDSAVKTIRMTQGGSNVACAINTTPGSSSVTAPTTAATYTIVPSALTTCQDVCTSVSNAATLNSYPTCGAATCNSGYSLSGSGSTATCVVPIFSSGDRRVVVPLPPTILEPPPIIALPPVFAPLPTPSSLKQLRLQLMTTQLKLLLQLLSRQLQAQAGTITPTSAVSPPPVPSFVSSAKQLRLQLMTTQLKLLSELLRQRLGYQH